MGIAKLSPVVKIVLWFCVAGMWGGLGELFVLGRGASPGEPPTVPASVAARSDPAQTWSFCADLCHPSFAGRLTGSPGYAGAARKAAEIMKKLGLKHYSPEGFLQAYSSPYCQVKDASCGLILPAPSSAGAPTAESLTPFKDFLPIFYSAAGTVEAEVVFSGWGISAPDLGYDDYAGIDVSGRFVLCFRGTPDPADRRFDPYDQHRKRFATARAKGARGLIYIYEKPQGNPNGDYLDGFLSAEMSEEAADRLLGDRIVRFAFLREELQRNRTPRSFLLPAKVRLQIDAEYFPAATGFNVVGILEGADPQLRRECLVVGAHLDGCGRFQGKVFTGANDNASGCASALEAARILATASSRPARSVVFALFGGEEKGLEGSQFFVDHLPAGWKIAGMINLDMTGEGAGAWCAFGPESAPLKPLVEAAVTATGVPAAGFRVVKSIGVRSSDFAPFFLKGVPIVNYSSDGPHVFYHEPGDDLHRVNPLIMADLARLTAATAWLLAK